MYLARTDQPVCLGKHDKHDNYEEFVSVPELVDYYNTNMKGGHEVEVYEGLQDCLGEVLVGGFIFSFTTDNYGDLA